MPCRFASSGTVATSRSASRAILALNVASNFLRDLVISVLHRLRQSRTLHTLTFGPISGVHFNRSWLPQIAPCAHYTSTDFENCFDATLAIFQVHRQDMSLDGADILTISRSRFFSSTLS